MLNRAYEYLRDYITLDTVPEDIKRIALDQLEILYEESRKPCKTIKCDHRKKTGRKTSPRGRK